MSTAVAPPAAAGRRRAATSRRLPVPFTTAVFALAVVAGVVLRAQVLQTTAAYVNADNAVVYLQAVAAEHGHAWVFFWGQTYGGTVLQITTGALMRVTRTSPYVFQWYTSLWWLAGAFSWRAVARRVWSPAAGDVLGAVVWLAGARLVTWSLVDAFYGPVLALSGALIALVLRPGRPTWRASLFAGLVAGVFVWTATFAFAFVVPAAVVFLLKRPRPVTVVVAAAGAVLGGLPFLAFNVRNHWISLHAMHSPWSDVPHRMWLALTEVVPGALPGAASHTVGLVIAWAVIAVTAAGLVTGVARRSAGDVLVASTVPLSLLLVAYSINPLDHLAYRYSVLVLPAVLTFVVGWLLLVRPPARGLVGLGVVTLVVVQTFVWAHELYPQMRGNRFGPTVDQVGAYLEQHHVDAVWANYWTSYPLTAETGGRVVAAPIAPARYPPYTARAAAVADTVVVLPLDMAADRELAQTPGLPAFSRTVVGDFVVYAFAGHVEQGQLPIAPF